MGVFRQAVREFFTPDSLELKLGVLSVKYTEHVRDDLAQLLGELRSKRVLFADLDHEIWAHVFESLKRVRETLTSVTGQLLRKGPDDVTRCIDLLIMAVVTYLADYEADYLRFMQGPWLSDLAPAHKERNWPALGEAAEDLVRLRRLFGVGLKSLAEFVQDGEILAWAEQEPYVAQHWIRYARERRLCRTCAWDLKYRRARCPYNYPSCPSFDPAETAFTYHRYGATAVQVAGSFSDWKPLALEQLEYGEWAVRVRIKPGVYHYKFIVDGTWLTDPRNSIVERDPAGNENSVLSVPGSG